MYDLDSHIPKGEALQASLFDERLPQPGPMHLPTQIVNLLFFFFTLKPKVE